ncbi:MAG TPA: HAMP domain-containing sensor histidine kinase [Polyangiaceae bacterium]|jgi:two-component system sensor histidine kinase RegB|nr:HAMP domain-containing sensor histidine kinase [Polyangiaceae bacterium]
MTSSERSDGVLLAWLTRLRWGSFAAQGVTVLIGVVALNSPFPPAALLVLGITLVSNLGLWALVSKRRDLEPGGVGAILAADAVALTVLLFLCGGPSNPFSCVYLVYVTLAALTLGARWAAVLVGVSSLGYAILFLVGDDMAGMAHMHHGSSVFSAHLQAMWVAFTVTAALIAYLVSRMARELHARDRALAQAQRLAARSEKLASLSALAAGAAHELGSPLGTIAVASKELALILGKHPELAALAEDAHLIRAEVDRCQRIVQEMSGRSGEPMGEVPEPIALDTLLGEVCQRSGALGLPVHVGSDVPQSVIVPVRGLVQSLECLVRNALDSGGERTAVCLRVDRDAQAVRFEVIDRGAGLSPDALARVGEPFFTTKAPGNGMGLGLFLASAFAQRWQGRLWLDSQPGQGTRAVLEVPFVKPEAAHAR